jgi:AraC-like DNA-binding protein
MVMEEWLPIGMDRHFEAAAFRNPFQRRLRQLEAEPVVAVVRHPAPPLQNLRTTDPITADWHYGYKLAIGCLELGAVIGNSAAATTANTVATATTTTTTTATVDGRMPFTVLLGYDGEARFQHDGQIWRVRSGDCFVLSGSGPGLNLSQASDQTMTWLGGLYSVVFFYLDPQRLLHTATVMGGGPAAALVEKLPLHRCACWSLPLDPIQVCLQAMLRESIEKVDQLLDVSPALLDRLQLDDYIYRLLVAMLAPELCQDGPYGRLRQRERQGRDAFDELIDYIKANLDQPLNLTLLEARSHYSRRTLQYAFRERLGCTATQWIRSQRLDLARQLLEHPRSGDTVASIAMAAGYRSLSLFSVDFQQRFHLKPSDLLREARTSSRLTAE